MGFYCTRHALPFVRQKHKVATTALDYCAEWVNCAIGLITQLSDYGEPGGFDTPFFKQLPVSGFRCFLSGIYPSPWENPVTIHKTRRFAPVQTQLIAAWTPAAKHYVDDGLKWF